MTDQELIQCVTDFRTSILGDRPSRRMCFVVCSPLATLLAERGVEVELVQSIAPDPAHHPDLAHHVWLRLADGRALDPTGDQVGLPPIYLGPPKRVHGKPGPPPAETCLTAEGAEAVEAAVAWLSAPRGREAANARRRFSRRIDRLCDGDPLDQIRTWSHAVSVARSILAGEVERQGQQLVLTIAGARAQVRRTAAP